MKRLLIIFMLIISFILQAKAQKEKLQSAYIYQFTKLIEWCQEYKSGDFVIGVLGSAPIVNELNSLKGKQVSNQSIVIKTFSAASEIDRCNILFIPIGKSGQLSAVNSKIGKNCTLVITEKPGLGKEGSSINFIEENGKIFFELNKTSLSKHSITTNPKLVDLAKAIYQ